ncbi:MAG: 4'-phosphopantetheinyl transferase superfamily protein [Flavobacteriales bacterium]|nr:4'-phosphopantetheinyl transferase superfamily protein [Flavobacteriales bacterium]MBK6946310.1 4'-phosphopantetheinyl transferase superfamily protein [Flavobacteriales bacterium]MBK7238738.1 4'-phosphopantetheinyl transferase superfamily protein [Flavobacteriales bacterium]MBK7297693.1 4'-phosphopantetheinyl transferase superfamily protein [Flavobacteriales bacterium]MBK9536360.1 4'-phosphopantetheinyl transferase superfamily protein [Flavobacteriales bacterium]
MSRVGRSLVVRCEPVQVHAFEDTVSRILEPDAVHAWFATVDQLRNKAEQYWELLDSAEHARADRFRFEKDKERFVLGHGWLRELLGVYLDLDPALVVMERGDYGKPFLAKSRLQFNLSDTKDAVFVAFTLGNEIGADVETMTRKVDHASVSEYYFTPEEIVDMSKAPDAKRRFLELWTRKEAVLKASGVGIMDDLSVLRVDALVNNNTITHEVFVEMAALEYHVRTWHIGTEHLISLASPISLDTVKLFSVQSPSTSPQNRG